MANRTRLRGYDCKVSVWRVRSCRARGTATHARAYSGLGESSELLSPQKQLRNRRHNVASLRSDLCRGVVGDKEKRRTFLLVL